MKLGGILKKEVSPWIGILLFALAIGLTPLIVATLSVANTSPDYFKEQADKEIAIMQTKIKDIETMKCVKHTAAIAHTVDRKLFDYHLSERVFNKCME